MRAPSSQTLSLHVAWRSVSSGRLCEQRVQSTRRSRSSLSTLTCRKLVSQSRPVAICLSMPVDLRLTLGQTRACPDLYSEDRLQLNVCPRRPLPAPPACSPCLHGRAHPTAAGGRSWARLQGVAARFPATIARSITSKHRHRGELQYLHPSRGFWKCRIVSRCGKTPFRRESRDSDGQRENMVKLCETLHSVGTH